MNSVTKIYAIDSICSLCSIGLPEKAPHPQIFDALYKIFISIKNDNWLKQYALFELLFLAQMGFGLDLTKCAVTGSRENLYYISPKTGRAVTKEVGNLYKNKLFIIPKFFLHEDVGASDDEIYSALMITGHFLNIYFYNINGGKLPIARNYLLTEFHKQIFGEKIA